MTAKETIEKIDWSELRNQKRTLLETIEHVENEDKLDPQEDTVEIVNNLIGLLHLIDSLQDYAVDEMGIESIHVYDFDDEEDRID